MRPQIEHLSRQMRAPAVRWNDWELKFLGLMLVIVAVGGSVAAAIILGS